jgi:hypothetical protein
VSSERGVQSHPGARKLHNLINRQVPILQSRCPRQAQPIWRQQGRLGHCLGASSILCRETLKEITNHKE